MTLLLDSEALSSIAHATPGRSRKVAALLDTARGREEAVATSAAILAEVLRGRPRDAAVYGALTREQIGVIDVDRAVAARAGALLAAAGAGSEDAVDAFLVATADRDPGSLVLTQDLEDIERLAAPCPHVRVARLP